jgi:hypothetical protein
LADLGGPEHFAGRRLSYNGPKGTPGARARGAAESQKIVRSTLSDSYLHYLWIKTLNENLDMIYVATEANLPIFKSVK